MLIGIQTFLFKKIRLKMSSSVKWRSFCLGLNACVHDVNLLLASSTTLDNPLVCNKALCWVRMRPCMKACSVPWDEPDCAGPDEVAGLKLMEVNQNHDDVIKWKHFPCYWPFVRGIPWSPVNSPHKGLWRGALMFYDVTVMFQGMLPGWVARQYNIRTQTNAHTP